MIKQKSSHSQYELHIKAGKTERHYWFDLLKYRELFFFLAWRDILVRYKQTVIGILWSVIRPVVTMIVFTIIFSNIAKLPSGGVPYPILVYAALLPWQFFSMAFSEASTSLVGSSGMISKVYFPRLIIPSSKIIVCLIDFFISLFILALLMIYYQFIPSINIIFLPFFLLMAIVTSLGSGLLIAALNVKYRDFQYIIPFIIQFGLYISPVGFSSAIVPEKFRFLYSINPMVGVIDGFRWSILGSESNFYLPGFILSIILICLIIFLGIWYFRKTEKTFADVI